MRFIAATALAGVFAVLAGVITSESPTIDRYFGPSVDAWSLADMCEIDSDPIACLIVLNDPVMSDACRRMAAAPTDSNIVDCYGIDDVDLSPVSVAEGR